MKRKFLSVLLALMMVISAVGGATVTANADILPYDATLTITPGESEITKTSGEVDVIYTLKISPPEGQHIGVFSFTLAAPAGMTLATNKTTTKGGDGYWEDDTFFYHSTFNPGGIFETSFAYTPETGVFLASGSNPDMGRILTSSAEFMTIKATITDASIVADYALVVTGENVGPDGTDKFTFVVDSQKVSVVDSVITIDDVDITTDHKQKPKKGDSDEPGLSYVAGDPFSGTIEWEPDDNPFKANTVYTAHFTLTANPGYIFGQGVSVKAYGAQIDDRTVSSDGKTLTFSYTFSATADKDMPTCVAPTGLTATYGDLLSGVTLTNPIGNTAGAWTWEDDSQAVGNVGTNTFKATFTPSDAATYQTVSNIDVDVTVGPKAISDVAISTISNQEYTGNEIKPELTVTGDSGKTLVEDVDYTVLYASNTNVGTATATVQAIAGGNYTFSDVSENFNIVAKAGAVSVSGDLNKTYDGASVDPTGLTVNTNGSTGALTYKYYTDPAATEGETTSAPKDAGAYSVKVFMAADSNFDAAVSDPFVFTISKAPLTVTADDMSITYGDPAPAYTVSYAGFKGSEDSSVLDETSLAYACDYALGSDAGDYTITPSGVAADNYDISFVAGTLTVSAKALANSMMATVDNVTYNNEEFKPTPVITDGSALVEGQDFTYSYSGNKDAGTATVTATGKGNYTGTATGTFVISPATYTYPVDTTQDISVGSGLEAITVATSSTTGVGAGGEAVTGTLKWYSDSDRATEAVDTDLNAEIAGNTVTLYWEFTATDANYTTVAEEGQTVFTIVAGAPQDLSFDTGDISKIYGDAAFTNAATNSSSGGGAITYTSSDTGVATVDASGEVTILKAGTTNITASAAAVTGTYAKTDISYTLTVGQRTISVQPNTFEITKEYDGTKNPGTDSGSISWSGILPADSGISVTTSTLPDYTDEKVHDETLNVPLVITGDTNNNYVLENSTVAVPASITVKDLGAVGPTVAITGTYTYTGSPIAPAFTVKDGGTDLASTDYDAVPSDNVDAGTGKLTVSAKAGGNYTWSPAVVETFTIGKGTYGGLTTGAVAAKYGKTVTFDLDTLGFPAGYTVSSLVIGGSILDNSKLTGKILEFELKNDPSLVDDTAMANVTIGGLANYDNFTASITITVLDKSTQAGFKFPSAAVNKVYGDDDFTVVATGEEAGSSVTYASDDTSVATVDPVSGEVTILKAGTAVITATASATTDYAVATDSYTLTVGKASITIQVMDKTVYVNSVAPDLSAPIAGTDYTVTGLIGADALATVPTLNYASAPDMSTTGTVAITAIGAGVPVGGNYDSTITYIDGTLTIRAKSSSSGSATRSYTLSFNTNGGSEIKSVSKVSGTLVDLAEYKPVREGYTFDGWYRDIALTNSLSTVTLDRNITVYAKWTEEQIEKEEPSFGDVKAEDWFYDAVRYVNENGLMMGTSASQFSPVEYTTRGMIVAILHRLEDLPKADLDGLFQDVNPNGYYAEAIAWASDKKIVSGHSDGSFGPDDYITREQMAVILMNYAKFKGYDVSAAADLSDFADSGKVSAWALDAMSWANAEAFIQGSGEKLMPASYAERAQVAAILQRFIEKNSK
jgi:uncharacterized repeat protein (TIGR02543 family)